MMVCICMCASMFTYVCVCVCVCVRACVFVNASLWIGWEHVRSEQVYGPARKAMHTAFSL